MFNHINNYHDIKHNDFSHTLIYLDNYHRIYIRHIYVDNLNLIFHSKLKLQYEPNGFEMQESSF